MAPLTRAGSKSRGPQQEKAVAESSPRAEGMSAKEKMEKKLRTKYRESQGLDLACTCRVGV